MPNSIKILSFILLMSLSLNGYLFYKNIMPNKNEILANDICNAKSVTYLFALENNKNELLNNMLRNDLVQLVHDYDDNIFSNSKVLSSVCKNWDKIVRPVIDNYNKVHSGKHSDFRSVVQDKYNKINSKCTK